jgi:hypothetical protein
MTRNSRKSGVLDEIRREKLQNKYKKLYPYTSSFILFLICVVLVCFLEARFFFSIAIRPVLGHTAYYLMGNEAASPGVNRVRREAENLLPSSVEVKNGGAITPLPLPYLHCIVLNQLSTRTILPLEDIYIFFRDDP